MEFHGIVTGGSTKAGGFGYPTANIPLSDTDVSGIYVVYVHAEGKTYGGVAYADQTRGILESHLFGFSGNLYGKEISVTLVEKLRDARAFPDEATLKAAIAADATAARSYIKAHPLA